MMSSIDLLEESRLSLQEFHARELRLLKKQQNQLTNELNSLTETHEKFVEKTRALETENKNYEKICQEKNENHQWLLLQIQSLEEELEKTKQVSDSDSSISFSLSFL
jgi:chromosome segregation ATPase